MKIYVNMRPGVARDSFFTEKIHRVLNEMGDVEFNQQEKSLSGEALYEKVKEADVLMTGWSQATIHAADIGDCKMIVHTGGTVGGIVDLDVFDTNTVVLSGNRYYSTSVAEGVIAYMLYALREMDRYAHDLKNGIWRYNSQTRGLIGKTVGIISLGAIGKEVVRLLSVLGVKIKAYSTTRDKEFAEAYDVEYAQLEEIFKTCDIVSVHTAKNDDTYHMINDKHFKLLNDGALFLNTSRGAVIDEQALIENLRDARFTAVLDVYEKEPLPQDSELMKLPNAIIFPHQAGPTFDLREKITEYLIEDIKTYFEGGKPRNIISKEIAKRMTKA